MVDVVALEGISVEEASTEYRRRRLDEWTDRRLVSAVASVLATPKVAAADSFVLHAPLELLARAGLLAYVRPAEREAARQRLVWLAASYAAAGEPLGDTAATAAPAEATSLDEVATSLVSALERGELDDVDRFARQLGAVATPIEIRRLLAAPVVTSLAAAAHASILLYLFPRSAPAGVTGELVRGPVRELARQPDWRLRWFDDPDDPVVGGSLAAALLDVPTLGLPGSDFIFPIMNQAEESGIAVKLLSGVCAGEVNLRSARQQLSRVAAWSMLQEPPDYAPYGWSHCLTMPQGVMGVAVEVADPQMAVAVAATYVVGFRAALGQRQLVPDHRPAPPGTPDLGEAISAGPDAAAAVAWHAPDDKVDDIVTTLATRASLHHDAHLVKYTLACLDAAAFDPGYRRLYLAAAASLSGWWAQHPDDGFDEG